MPSRPGSLQYSQVCETHFPVSYVSGMFTATQEYACCSRRPQNSRMNKSAVLQRHRTQALQELISVLSPGNFIEAFLLCPAASLKFKRVAKCQHCYGPLSLSIQFNLLILQMRELASGRRFFPYFDNGAQWTVNLAPLLVLTFIYTSIGTFSCSKKGSGPLSGIRKLIHEEQTRVLCATVNTCFSPLDIEK